MDNLADMPNVFFETGSCGDLAAWNLQRRNGRLDSLRSSCLCLLRPEIKGMHAPSRPVLGLKYIF